MVSKVAVIALVAIVACPILLGYAMNLSEVTETDYKAAGESVNVTPILQNDIDYTSVQSNVYQINSSFNYFGTNNNPSGTAYPIFESTTTTTSSMPMTKTYYTGNHPMWGGASGISLENWGYLYYQTNTTSGGHVVGHYCDEYGNELMTINYIHSFYYDPSTKILAYSTYVGGGYGNLTYGSITDVPYNYRFGLTDTGTYTSNGFAEYILLSDPSSLRYVDLAAGYHFSSGSSTTPNPKIVLPNNTKSFIMSVNLGSVTDPNYTFNFNILPKVGSVDGTLQYAFVKTTVGSDVTWTFKYGYSLENEQTLYIDPTKNNNTYQLIFNLNVEPYTNTHDNSTLSCSLNYVGSWQTVIGKANPYQTYDIEPYTFNTAINQQTGLIRIEFKSQTTPVMRMDAATYDGYEVPVISEKTYDPAQFKTNPATTINNVSQYGSSLVFGGNTYAVSDGKITINSHQIPVNGMVLESVPNGSGYDNRINGTVISSTADPSTILFKGKWAASVSTQSMESYTYTKTEWTPGEFGWNGIDQNFLMVGLLTSIGVFIALGIYIRRSKANLWPLLIVCGGAAFIFFCML